MISRSGNRALEQLGARLRAVREEAGLTGTELAVRLGRGWAQPKISKIETGRQLPTEAEVRAWANATVATVEELLVLRGHAAEIDLPRVHRDRAPESYTHLAAFTPAVVPDRLQTAAYLRHCVTAALPISDNGMTAESLGHAIAAAIRHQALLYEPGREFVHVVTEAALRLRTGSMTISTLRGQLLHLAELATLPAHTFGVLPFATACPVPSAAGFGLYDRELVRVETPAGYLEFTEPEVVTRYGQWLDRLVDTALTGPAAADFCRQVATTLPD